MARSTALYRNKAALQAALRELPASPGIYRFYDVTEAVIYVGKSLCLRDRVRSYFTGRADTKKLRRLRQEITRLDWEETGSELEALLLESRLVKRLQPRFNRMLKTFVPLPYVRVDLGDPFPRLDITRSPERDGAAYFGPFRSQNTLEAAVGGLSDALRLRTCEAAGERLASQRPCYRYELGTCSGPCLGPAAQDDYRTAVGEACRVLSGGSDSPLRALEARMARAAENLQFETAARLRDAIRQIRSVMGRQHALRSAVQDLTLVAACPSRKSDSLCLFVFRSGRLVLQEDVPLDAFRGAGSRREWARRLVEAGWSRPGAEEPGAEIDAALLDEIQIVTAWMQQKTREGAYWQFPRGLTRGRLAAELGAWLSGLAPQPGDRLAA